MSINSTTPLMSPGTIVHIEEIEEIEADETCCTTVAAVSRKRPYVTGASVGTVAGLIVTVAAFHLPLVSVSAGLCLAAGCIAGCSLVWAGKTVKQYCIEDLQN